MTYSMSDFLFDTQPQQLVPCLNVNSFEHSQVNVQRWISELETYKCVNPIFTKRGLRILVWSLAGTSPLSFIKRVHYLKLV